MSRRPMPMARSPKAVTLALALGTAACGVGVGAPTPVSPAEIPELEQRLSQDPQDGAILARYAAALYAAGRCDTAKVVARVAWSVRPSDATAPLVIGECAERDEDYDQALQAYRDFLERNPQGAGVPAVRAREMMATRARAGLRARQALEQEAVLAGRAPNPEAVAVLPLEISGDSSYQPLSRGLAQMITSDLALLRRFPLVERLELGALLDEMALAQTERVDSASAVRVGYLVQAGRLVQGLAAIPPTGDMRLEAGVVQSTGEVLDPAGATGRFEDLMQLEKAIVLILARRLGYQLSEAERQLILENGTQNLAAFLAYSRGLLEEDRGNYEAAAGHYAAAAQADPNFRAARERHQATTAAPMAQQFSASQLPVLAALTVDDPTGVGDAAEEALGPTSTTSAVATGFGDLGSTFAEQTAPAGAEQTTQQISNTPISQPPPTAVQFSGGIVGTIRIIIRIP